MTMRDTLLRQLDIAWALASYHLDGLTTDECLWRPAARGLHVHHDPDGGWRGDWPEHEGYDLAHRPLVVDGPRSLVRRRSAHPPAGDLAGLR
jgi:hypothetical protein